MAASRSIAALAGVESRIAQPLLAAAAQAWRAEGANVVGVIGEAPPGARQACGAGTLRDLGTGKPYRIYLDAAPQDTSCLLDPAGVEAACADLVGRIGSADVVILSKFGKLETMGRGLTPAFEAARAAGKPVVTAVSAEHLEAWRRFAPDALDLPAEAEALLAWRAEAATVG